MKKGLVVQFEYDAIVHSNRVLLLVLELKTNSARSIGTLLKSHVANGHGQSRQQTHEAGDTVGGKRQLNLTAFVLSAQYFALDSQ